MCMCERCNNHESDGMAIRPFSQLCRQCYIEIVDRLAKSLRDAASVVH